MFRVSHYHFIQDVLVKHILICCAGNDLINRISNCPDPFLLLFALNLVYAAFYAHAGHILMDNRLNDAEQMTDNLFPVILQTMGYKIHDMDGIFIADTGAGTPNVVSRWVNVEGTIPHCFIAPPCFIPASILPLFIPGNIACTTTSTLDFSGKRVAVGVL